MELLWPGIRSLRGEVARNPFFNEPFRQFCCITVVIVNKDPWRLLAQDDTAEVVSPGASSRGAVLNVNWWDWSPKKGKRSKKVG